MTDTLYVVEVAPLTAIPRNQNQILTYFSAFLPPIGSLVEAPFRNKKITAVVVNAETLQSAKIRLKKELDFTIKKLTKPITEGAVLTYGEAGQLNTAFWLSTKYYAPLGLCLKTVLPPFAGKKKYPARMNQESKIKNHAVENTEIAKSFITISDPINHYKNYLSIIKKNVSKQILFLVPETTHLDYYTEKLAEFKPEVLHSGANNKKFHEIYQRIATGEPLLLISTRVGAFLPWQNLGLIILDHESNPAYRSDTTPKYTTPDLARYLAKSYGAELVISDVLPRIETAHELGLSDYALSPSPYTLVDMVKEIKDANYSPFSAELKEQIKISIAEKKKLIIFVPRKGYAPYLLCKKCGETVRCKNCDYTLVVHQPIPHSLNPIPSLICHHCEATEPMQAVCPKCKGGILEYKGLGIQKAIEKLKVWLDRQNITAPPMLELSNDTATSRAEADKIIEEFKANPATILFSTQKIFSYLYLIKADLIAILNADLLANFVDWRADEEALRDLLTLTKMSEQTIIQSYHVDSTPIKTLATGDIDQFIKNELANRQALNYPPFCEILKLTFRHRKSEIAFREAKIIKEKLHHEIRTRNLEKELQILGPNLGQREKGLYAQELILKIKNVSYAEASADQRKKRSDLLRILGADWRVEVAT